MVRTLLHRVRHHLRVWTDTTEALAAIIIGLAGFEAWVLARGMLTAGQAFGGWFVFAVLVVAFPWFVQRFLGEDEPRDPDVPVWQGIPG